MVTVKKELKKFTLTKKVNKTVIKCEEKLQVFHVSQEMKINIRSYEYILQIS